MRFRIPFLHRKPKPVPIEQPSVAQQARDKLWDLWYCFDHDGAGFPYDDDDGKCILPRGVYTEVARELGTDPTYVSIVAKKAGFRIVKKSDYYSELPESD